MSRKLTASIVLLTSLLMIWPAASPAEAQEETGREQATELRRWYLGLQGTRSDHQRFDIFGRDGIPPAEVLSPTGGAGFQFGHRFGGRFLLGLQLVGASHDLSDNEQKLIDVEVLITGTILFRETSFFVPFLRGGIGGNGMLVEHAVGNGHTFAFGPAAIAGGGLQLRLGAGVSLEFEAMGTFANYLEVHDYPEGQPEEGWRVRTSNQGWRVGTGICLWF